VTLFIHSVRDVKECVAVVVVCVDNM